MYSLVVSSARTHQIADVVLQRRELRVDLLQAQLEALDQSCNWQ